MWMPVFQGNFVAQMVEVVVLMAKYIDREALERCIKEENHNLAGLIQHIREHCPTADVVEVVRCKDCVFWDNGRCEGIQNGLIYDFTEPDDFCSYGGKRSDTE